MEPGGQSLTIENSLELVVAANAYRMRLMVPAFTANARYTGRSPMPVVPKSTAVVGWTCNKLDVQNRPAETIPEAFACATSRYRVEGSPTIMSLKNVPECCAI